MTLPQKAWDRCKEGMNHKRFYIQTFGCQMNVHDSEQMSELLISSGYAAVDNPESADIIILNTCSIRHKAEQKAHSRLGRFRKYKDKNPDVLIGVAGCLAQQKGSDFRNQSPFLDMVIGTHNVHLLPRMIEEASRRKSPVVETCFRDHVESIGIFARPAPGSISAFVTVMQGCNNFCAYCVVPYLRGREESRKMQDILEEIRRLADHGIKEVTLLGQNVNSYGKTIGDGTCFAALLRETGKIKGIERIRFTTSHPKDLTDDIVACYAEVEQLCEHIHLPVQSGSDRILERMNRKYTSADYLKKVDKLREICSNISITSDIIVGFPGETEEDFRKTIDLMEKVKFDSVFSFNYSDREGAAAVRFDNKIEEAVKRERLYLIQDLQKKHTWEKNKSLVGTLQKILVEGQSRNSDRDMTGRTRTNKIVNYEGDIDSVRKTMVVGIEKAFLHSLRGKLLDQKEEGAL